MVAAGLARLAVGELVGTDEQGNKYYRTKGGAIDPTLGFERLQVVPLLIITPLTFLGGTFYPIHVLPPFWQKVTLFNPVVYLVSGFRWSFFGTADVSVLVSLVMTMLFLATCLAAVWWIFKTGYRLKS